MMENERALCQGWLGKPAGLILLRAALLESGTYISADVS